MKIFPKYLLLLSFVWLSFLSTIGCPSGTTTPATTPNQNQPAVVAPPRTPAPNRTPAPATPQAPAQHPQPQATPQAPQAMPVQPPTPQAPQDVVPGAPSPAHIALASSPSYCQAMLTTAQANELSRFVVETYNKMNHIPGFKRAQINTSGEQPVVTFANPATPSLYFPKKGSQLHTTLCNSPGSPFFLCSNKQLSNSAAASARSPNPISAYINYYEKEMSGRGYTYDAPQEFGPLFVSLPLHPKELQNTQGQVVSGLLHVSLVKVWTSNLTNPETPTSAGLRAEFVRALKQEFANKQSALPSTLNFHAVRCLP